MENLSQIYTVRYIRYADDFVILTRERQHAESIYPLIAQKLTEYHLELHPSKTRISSISTGELQFVGFRFKASCISVKPANIKKFKSRFDASLEKVAQSFIIDDNIIRYLRKLNRYILLPKVRGVQPVFCPQCGKQKEPNRNWISFFAPALTDKSQIHALDSWMRAKIYQYMYINYHTRLSRRLMRYIGVKSLMTEYYKQRSITYCTCKDIQNEE